MRQNIQGTFFPEKYLVSQREIDGTEIIFDLFSTSKSAICPKCGTKSMREHGFQDRKVKDLPILGKSTTLFMSQKKYFCDNGDCDVDIFTESNDLVGPYYQFTERCREYMLKVTTLASCEAAVKILTYQGIQVCGDTLLNMIKAAGEKYNADVGNKIGVDDWAYRRGQTYGTIICDLETHKVIDVIKGRDSEVFEKWLKGHPNIEIVSRDRASAYESAVRKTLPDAVQIADRFHITKNLLDALKDTMKAFMPEVVNVPKTADLAEDNINETSSTIKNKQTLKKTPKNSNAKHHK